MRRFIDLHLRQPDDSTDELEFMFRLAAERGYTGVAYSSGRVPPTMLKNLCRELDVDLISRINLASISTRSRVWFDRQEAVLASGANCAYEINASDMLGKGSATSARLLSIIRREVENAKRHDVPTVVSSGADSRLLMREPRGLVALLDLVGVDEEEGLDMVSMAPWRIVEANRGKLASGFIAPGVRVVDWDAR